MDSNANIKNIKRWVRLMDIFSKYWGCHQLPERSFFINGYQFPVCARCTGIIIGEVSSIFCYVLHLHFLPVIYLVALLIPLVIDGLVQYKTSYQSNNVKRVITGILFGYSFFQFILIAIERTFFQ